MSRPPENSQGLSVDAMAFLEKAIPSGFGKTGKYSALAGDASDRKYYRVYLGSGDSKKGNSLVLMQLERPWRPEGSRQELPFVNIGRYLAAKGLPVPEIRKDASSQGFILLEDVGDLTLQDYLGGQPHAEQMRQYRLAIDLLVEMQKPAAPAREAACYAMGYGFDVGTFVRELSFFCTHALEGLWGKKIPARQKKELEGCFRWLSQEILGYPMVFTHRDYHSRNLMVQANRLVLLDFQDARLGPVTYDLASLIRDSYVGISPVDQECLIRYYRERALGAGIDCMEEASFLKAFNFTALQRNLKAIGTFAFQAVVKKREQYLASIPNTIQSVRFALASDPELKSLAEMLRHYMDGL